MKKHSIVPILILLAGVSLVSCNKSNSAQEPVLTLIMAEVNPLESISGQMDFAFKQKVEELSDGKIQVNLRTGGSLGDSIDILNEMVSGSSLVDILRLDSMDLSIVGCKKNALLTVPFTFKDRERFWKFANSVLADEILSEPYNSGLGIRGLFYGEEGFHHFFSSKPLESIDDFKNLNLRVASDRTMIRVVEKLNARFVPVSFINLYSELQTGAIDAAEQAITNYFENSFYKVAPHMILDKHTLGVTEVVISSKIWESLSENQKRILIEAGQYAGEYCKLISEEVEQSTLEKLKDAGVSIVEVTDYAPWKEACESVIENSTRLQADLYAKIRIFSD